MTRPALTKRASKFPLNAMLLCGAVSILSCGTVLADDMPIPTPEQARAARNMPAQLAPASGPMVTNPIPAVKAEEQQSNNAKGGPQATTADSVGVKDGEKIGVGEKKLPEFSQSRNSAEASRGDTLTAPGAGSPLAAQPGAAQTMDGKAALAQTEPPATQPSVLPASQLESAELPIGSTGETQPAKYSERNAILDRVPIMAFPTRFTDAEVKRIVDTVMSEKTADVPGAGELQLTSQLTAAQADAMKPLPAGLKDMPQFKVLNELGKPWKYVKAGNRILLVEPSTQIVVEQFSY